MQQAAVLSSTAEAGGGHQLLFPRGLSRHLLPCWLHPTGPHPCFCFRRSTDSTSPPQTAPPNTPNTQTHNNGQDMHCLRDPGLPLCISVGLTLLHAYAHTPGIKRHVLHIHYRFINDTRLGRTWPARWWLVEFEKCQQIKWKRRYWLASCHLDCISQTFPKIPSKKKLKSWASYVTMSWLSWLMSFSAFDIFFFLNSDPWCAFE